MSKIYNYPAFYVSEPFSESSLGAHASKDFCYYNLLKAWKSSDNSFPFRKSAALTLCTTGCASYFSLFASLDAFATTFTLLKPWRVLIVEWVNC